MYNNDAIQSFVRNQTRNAYVPKKPILKELKN